MYQSPIYGNTRIDGDKWKSEPIKQNNLFRMNNWYILYITNNVKVFKKKFMKKNFVSKKNNFWYRDKNNTAKLFKGFSAYEFITGS